jgi:uncharacterized protein
MQWYRKARAPARCARNNPDYYEAAGRPKRIWRIETSHTHGLSARPKEYERRVVGFFDGALLARPGP